MQVIWDQFRHNHLAEVRHHVSLNLDLQGSRPVRASSREPTAASPVRGWGCPSQVVPSQAALHCAILLEELDLKLVPGCSADDPRLLLLSNGKRREAQERSSPFRALACRCVQYAVASHLALHDLKPSVQLSSRQPPAQSQISTKPALLTPFNLKPATVYTAANASHFEKLCIFQVFLQESLAAVLGPWTCETFIAEFEKSHVAAKQGSNRPWTCSSGGLDSRP